MGELKASEGPYKLEKDAWGSSVILSGDYPIAKTIRASEGCYQDANGHLLRSSRELYEALALCLDLIDDMSRFAGVMSLEDYGAFNQAPIIARAALSAARGETGQQS